LSLKTVLPLTLHFETVYRENFTFVYRMARHLGAPNGLLEDVSQDVFAAVSRKLESYDGRVSVRSWLYGFVRRVVADHRRRRIRKESKVHSLTEANALEQIEDVTQAPMAAAENSQAFRRLGEILQTLSPEKREAFLLFEVEGLTAPEIAEMTQSNLEAVYGRLRNAREEVSVLYSERYGRRDGKEK
jgi:RNA polymerase sigma factor (sigma-70 family)